MKNIFLMLLMVLVGSSSWGQVYQEDFGNNATVVVPYSSGTNATGSVIKNANITTPSWNQNLSSANFAGNTLGAMSATVGTSTYTITCTFSVNSGYQFNPTTIGFDNRGSGSAPNALAISISGTGGSTSASATPSRSGAFTTTSPVSFSNTSLNLTGAITLTFTFTGGTSGGTERFDNMILNGSVTATAIPSVAISTSHPVTANITQGRDTNILAAYQLAITTADATLKGISVTTAGSYSSSDIKTNGFKFYINSSVSLIGATQLGTSQAAVNSGGTLAVSGLSQSITSGTTRFILVTADIANSALINNAISLTSTDTANITFTTAAKTGTNPASASNAQTIIACTGANVTGAAATNGNTNSSVSWTNPSCYDEILIVARAGSANDGTPTGNGSAYTANLSYNSGTALGSGFVVYKGSSSPQVVTNLTNGTQYFFKIFTRKASTWTSGVEVSATPAAVSAATDYFRSNVSSGSWATAGNWQSSVDSSNWITSTLVPDSTSKSITIINGNTITIGAGVIIDQVILKNGGILNFNSASIVVSNGVGNDITIENGGQLTYSNATFSYNTNSTVSVNTGGIISIEVSGITGAGAAIHQTSHIFNTGSILQYNITSQPSSSGITYFPNVNAATIPIFRFMQNLVGNVGATNPTVINGMVQYGAAVTTFGWSSNGLKTFRNGITALGTTTVTATGGTLQIGDANTGTAEIGGTGTLTISSSAGINITSNCTATLSSNIVLSAGTLTNNGILTCSTNTITGAGLFTNAATGTVITSNTGGVTSTIAVSGAKTYAAGSSFTLNGNTSTPFPSTIGSNQIGTLNINATVTSNYANSIIITGACNVNSGGRFNLNGTNDLTLNTGTSLTIATNGVFDNGGTSQITLGGGTPTITINGRFITRDLDGFLGTNATIPSATLTPTLGSSSTIEYAASSGTQVITTSPSYVNLVLSSGGTKTTASALSISDTLTISGATIFNASNSTIGGSGTKLTMTGTSRYILAGTGIKPDATGAYSLGSGTTIEFTNNAGTLQTLRSAPSYYNIDISGNNVGSTLSSGISMQTGSTFKVTSTGTFKFTNANGFYRLNNSAIDTTNKPTISLQAGSTLDFNASTGSQVVDARSDYRNLTISNAATKTMAGNVTVADTLRLTSSKVSIAGNTLTLNGFVRGMSASNSLTGSNSSKLTVGSASTVGTIYFDQTTSADVSTTNGSNALQNLAVTGSGNVTLGNKVNLFEKLNVKNSSTLNTGDVLVLRSIAGSSSNNTAYVDSVGGTISGQVTVERYIHKAGRGWRTLTAPVTYNGIISNNNDKIANNWQSSFGYTNNYGTRITGPSATNGIDDATTGSSLQTYNSTSGAWSKVTNTNTETQSGSSATAANKGFFIFIRGDRTVVPNGPNPNTFVTTTLASKGLLQTGTQTFNFNGAANKSWLVGNPYACSVDMSTITYNNIGDFVYVWDPNLAGSSPNTNGGYAAFDRTNWATPATVGSSTKYFQSGQAFFITPNSATASVQFTEANKITTQQNNQVTGVANGVADIFNVKLLSVKDDGTRTEADGVRAKFGSDYSADVDEKDAIKFASSIENISLSRNGKSLVIEARPYITTTDTLFLHMTTTSVGANYEFKVSPINFDASVSSCKLVDNFLNTETPISLNNNTIIGFNVTNVAGSNAANRFYIVFNATGNLPTNNLNVKAYKKNNTVVVDWESVAENNVKNYSIEKSIDGNSFSKLADATAKNNNATNNYTLIDNTPNTVNYYRIKTINNNNNEKYSAIVKVEMNSKGTPSIAVYPNPIKGSTIGVQLNNIEAGKYTAKLFNISGQQVWTNTIIHNGSNGSVSLQFNTKTSAGNYELQLIDAKGNAYKQKVFVIE